MFALLSATAAINLPLDNPVLIFTLILFIILFAPILFNKLGIPQLIGLILAGIIIGPNGLNLMMRDSSIILFGTVGLLYIMFLAGLEIDMAGFRKNSGKSIAFGLYTFIVPMGLGTAAALYIMGLGILPSVLLASMFASHTPIAYPIISRLGVAKNRAVSIAVGGTVITDTLALLVLAIIVGMSTGEISNEFWIRLSASIVVFALVVVFIFPLIARWFLKKYDDSVSQYVFVLGMVFLGAFLAEAAGIEPIIGAFLVGLSLNRLILDTSALMNRIEFVGNALFIPFFLLGVGMLIDYRMFFKDFETIKTALTMTVVATTAKFSAAWLTQKTFRMSRDERRLIFGLSNSQAAATLAAVLVGFNVITGTTPEGEPIRLLNESVLNGAILMILITCTIASVEAQRGAQNIALEEASEPDQESNESPEKILIPLSNSETLRHLVELGTAIKSKKSKFGLHALVVIDNNQANGSDEKRGRKILEQAAIAASAADNHLYELVRFDLNIVNGITAVIKEHKISDLILGVRPAKGITESFMRNIMHGVLSKSNTTTLIYKAIQPLSTVKRHVVVIPGKAEKEMGFLYWLVKTWNIARNTGIKIAFYANEQTLGHLRQVHKKHPIDASFHEFSEWSDFLILSREIRQEDNLIVVMSRRDHPSYHPEMERIPDYMNRHFRNINFLLIYPMQSGVATGTGFNLKHLALIDPTRENYGKLDDIGRAFSGLFKRR